MSASYILHGQILTSVSAVYNTAMFRRSSENCYILCFIDKMFLCALLSFESFVFSDPLDKEMYHLSLLNKKLSDIYKVTIGRLMV